MKKENNKDRFFPGQEIYTYYPSETKIVVGYAGYSKEKGDLWYLEGSDQKFIGSIWTPVHGVKDFSQGI